MTLPVFWVIAAAVALRLVFAAFTGLGIDESYMVAAASRFDWSYFDHPPVSWWLELGARFLLHSQAPLAVRLPFVALSAVSSWLLYALTKRLYGARPGFWAVVAYSISPVFSLAFGSWVLPDGPLDAALLATAYCVVLALGITTPPAPRWWLAAGVFAGLAMLCKYNAALVLAGAGAAMLTDPASHPELRRWQPWAAVLIAAFLFAPVICWNAVHGWQSFHYQSGRAAGWHLHPLAPFSILGGEALFLLPWLWAPIIALLIAALRRGPAERRDWLLAMLGIIPIGLFAVIGIWSSTRILYHWAMPGYQMLLPLLGNWAAGFRWRKFAAVTSAILLAAAAMLLAAQVQFAFVPNLGQIFPPGKSPLLQLVDWRSIAVPPGTAVATLRWYDAGKIGYALGAKTKITVFGPEPHQFGISTPPASLIGQNILLIAMPGDISAIARQYAPDFKTLQPAPSLTVIDHGQVLLVIPALLGTDMLKAP